MKNAHRASGICFVVIVLMMSVALSGCSIPTTTSTRQDEDGQTVKSRSIQVGTPFGTIGTRKNEDEENVD